MKQGVVVARLPNNQPTWKRLWRGCSHCITFLSPHLSLFQMSAAHHLQLFTESSKQVPRLTSCGSGNLTKSHPGQGPPKSDPAYYCYFSSRPFWRHRQVPQPPLLNCRVWFRELSPAVKLTSARCLLDMSFWKVLCVIHQMLLLEYMYYDQFWFALGKEELKGYILY